MHKYSYELSASYRLDTFQPRSYFAPSIPSPISQPVLKIEQRDATNRSHSTNFIKKQHTEVLSNLQAKRHHHQVQTNLKEAFNRTTYKIQEAEARLDLWKPNQTNGLQNRIKALSHLGQRHEQAIRELDSTNNFNGRSPIRGLQDTPQAPLKRQFSFNRIQQTGPDSSRAYMMQKQQYFKGEPLKSKQSTLNMNMGSQIRMSDKQRNQLRINKDINNGIEKRYLYQNKGDHLKLNKTMQPSETVAKLSSLQDRIKNSIQPHLRK